MNKKFQAQLIQARRAQIIEAAIEVIAEQGFQRTTIKQIAQRADVADGTIYNYFKNKDAILLAILELLTEAEVRYVHFAEAKQLDFTQFVTEYVAHKNAGS
ncbi:TetR/AcrR family transcriptional regulator [Chloroflexi bacterium TSY]|nr:TetR/AcrR family transcriptional regulator [Chloroflexi bacterium TSY]